MQNSISTTITSKPKMSVNNKPKRNKVVSKKNEEIDIFKFLNSLKEFSKLSEQDLKELIAVSRLATFDPSTYITIEGDEASSYGFIVISGCVSMLKTSANGKDLIVELLQAGDTFGLLLMLAKERLPAQLSARALRKTIVLWVPLNYFTRLLHSHPESLKDYIGNLLVHLQSSYQLSRGLAHDHVQVRIATVLSSLAVKLAHSFPADRARILNFTRQQLADLTGTTAETAIRVTRSLQHQGIIDIKRPGVIQILNLQALNSIAEC